MNKGVIIELSKKNVIVLTRAGEFRSLKRVKGTSWDVGDEIEVESSVSLIPWQPLLKKWWIPVATVMLLLVVFSLSFTPTMEIEAASAVIQLDINPSVEIGIDKELKVVYLEGLNQDGQQLLSSLENLRGESLEAVGSRVIQEAGKQGYLRENRDVLVSTVFLDEESESTMHEPVLQVFKKMESEISSRSAEYLTVEESNKQSSVPIHIHQVQATTVLQAEAKEQGLSVGKYSLYLEARQQGIELELEEVKQSSVSQLTHKLNNSAFSLNPKNEQEDKKDKKDKKDKEKEEQKKQAKEEKQREQENKKQVMREKEEQQEKKREEKQQERENKERIKKEKEEQKEKEKEEKERKQESKEQAKREKEEQKHKEKEEKKERKEEKEEQKQQEKESKERIKKEKEEQKEKEKREKERKQERKEKAKREKEECKEQKEKDKDKAKKEEEKSEEKEKNKDKKEKDKSQQKPKEEREHKEREKQEKDKQED